MFDYRSTAVHPDSQAPGYSAMIQKPMDLSTMRSKIGRVHQPYDTLGAFEPDAKLLVENCKLFNGTKSVYVSLAAQGIVHLPMIEIL